jgi:aminopeptidase N
MLAVLGVGLFAACSASVGGQGRAVTNAITSPSESTGRVITVPKSGPAPGPSTLSKTPSSAAPHTAASGTAAPGPHELPAPDGAVGSRGIGDPYYPDAGNGGYEVDHYDIDLAYEPTSNRFSAVTTVTGKVTEATKLGRFDLDLQPTMKVSVVTVNGVAAAFRHDNAELVITPASGLPPGAGLTVIVTYAGGPDVIRGGAANLGDGGWYRTPSGGAIAIGEPFSGSAWYPVNEHPSDTATYRVTATVPQKWSVISGGVAVTAGLPAAPAGEKVFRWNQPQPIASYQATIYIDTFTTVTDTTTDGKPIVSAFAPGAVVVEYQNLAKETRRILQVLGNHFGPYPFDAAGGIYTGLPLQFALETATRPVYANWVDTDTIVHELTHQWFGDDVVIKRWSDICLNECFASYGPWLWHQDVDGTDLDTQWIQDMAGVAAVPSFWTSPLVDMGAGNEFTSVYSRGPLAIHALRKQMGERNFATLLKGWPATYGGRAAGYQDLVGYVNKISGQDLTAFMNAWFRGTVRPPARFLHPGGLGR